MRFLIPTVLGLALFFSAGARAGNVPCENYAAELDVTGHVVLVSPGGTAPSLADQGVTVTVEILDCDLEPIEWFPKQDIWLDSFVQGEIGICMGGTMADAHTDATGTTTISGSLAAGGFTSAGTTLTVVGQRMDHLVHLDLDLVSPDLDGDLDVDLSDFTAFGLDFGQSGVRRSDLSPDGVVGLADFSVFGRHYSETCP